MERLRVKLTNDRATNANCLSRRIFFDPIMFISARAFLYKRGRGSFWLETHLLYSAEDSQRVREIERSPLHVLVHLRIEIKNENRDGIRGGSCSIGTIPVGRICRNRLVRMARCPSTLETLLCIPHPCHLGALHADTCRATMHRTARCQRQPRSTHLCRAALCAPATPSARRARSDDPKSRKLGNGRQVSAALIEKK